jgi:hypothetical protein
VRGRVVKSWVGYAGTRIMMKKAWIDGVFGE